MKSPQSNIVQFPVAPFVLEIRTERFVDVMLALQDAGFKVTYVRGSLNRYRVDDQDDDPGRR